MADEKQEGGCRWAKEYYSYNLQSTAIYMQLSTTQLVTLPQQSVNRSFY